MNNPEKYEITLEGSERIDSFQKAMAAGESMVIEGLWDAPKALITKLALEKNRKNILIISGLAKEENLLFHDLKTFCENQVYDFPAWETMPSEQIPPSPDIVGERYKVLEKLSNEKQPVVVLASVQACLQKMILPERLKALCKKIKIGDDIPFSELISQFVEMGYERKVIATDKGEFSVRGGIIDIYPVSSPSPYRIEFWGDEVESLRKYDPVGQRSVEQASEVLITPALEMELIEKEETLASLLNYLGPETILIFDDLLAIEDRYVTLEGMMGVASSTFLTFHSFFDSAEKWQKIFLTPTDLDSLAEVRRYDKEKDKAYSLTTPMHTVSFEIFDREILARRWFSPFQTIREFFCPIEYAEGEVTGDDILKALPHVVEDGLQVEALCSSESDEKYLHDQLENLGLSLPEKVEVKRGYLSTGFVLTDRQKALLPLAEVTRRYKIRRQKLRTSYHTTSSEMHELVPGDLVVHLNSGIGKFLGIEKQRGHGDVEAEFFVIEYSGNSKLFVPLSQAHLVTKYIGAKDDEQPKINAIGSSRWKKIRSQTEKAVMGYAAELLHLYAERKVKPGIAYQEDSEETHRFERDFPFVETEDQLVAIDDVKRDMMAVSPMDRLVCGDVGYGKTEVAMRAAFKAVVDGGKQVAVLVPTTVLAMQHFETFEERMWNFPVRVGVLSRFRSAKQVRKTKEEVAKGSIDILIGTHRILSGDLQFKDLGLVIIDEEQRFGVRAKESLRAVKSSVDSLALSATPIPRTLYMSLFGARDMSVVNTPPQDRLPIKTIICETDDAIIKNALLRELTRDGQAYVIHNRVESIQMVALKIQKLLPQARVVISHGQMPSEDIDAAFHAFKSGDADIMVATTIVENGLDIPNANTIIIDRADSFGLADLYQLRGRVGRWNRRAYAYLLTPKKKALQPFAKKRLEAFVEACGSFGGGMRIAMRDLELRGAGNILGTEQSGHVSAVGFHLYCKLLQRTVDTLQGKLPASICDTKLEFSYNAHLPEDYVPATSLRLEMYQRLGEAYTLEDVDTILEELKDRYGTHPEEVMWLYHLTRLRVFAGQNHITTLKVGKNSITIEGREKGELVVKKVLINDPKSPEDLEKKVVRALKKSSKKR